ncbi:acyl-coenzyme A thioesterase-like protein 13 [Xylogone sp. PMI_703]|nr:acyl-coenzyme A thioesterase-like protein 13 [Xylogone sp. PMI_703]
MEISELDHVKEVWQKLQGNSPIYDFLLPDVKIVSAIKGKFVAHLVLKQNHVNSRGTIHGAVSATLVDWSGGMAIATHGLEKTGASIDIHITYVSTAQVGDTIEIEALANKVGRTMAFTTCKISKLVNGKAGPIVATASHTKYLK